MASGNTIIAGAAGILLVALPGTGAGLAGTCSPVDAFGRACISVVSSGASTMKNTTYMKLRNSCKHSIGVNVNTNVGVDKIDVSANATATSLCFASHGCTSFLSYEVQCYGAAQAAPVEQAKPEAPVNSRTRTYKNTRGSHADYCDRSYKEEVAPKTSTNAILFLTSAYEICMKNPKLSWDDAKDKYAEQQDRERQEQPVEDEEDVTPAPVYNVPVIRTYQQQYYRPIIKPTAAPKTSSKSGSGCVPGKYCEMVH